MGGTEVQYYLPVQTRRPREHYGTDIYSFNITVFSNLLDCFFLLFFFPFHLLRIRENTANKHFILFPLMFITF